MRSPHPLPRPLTLCPLMLALTLLGLWAPPQGLAAERPNIVVILADDLGYGDVGFNGCRDIPTPHLDALARDGVRFAHGYSSHPFCSPMRAGLMTGRYQHRFGYVTNVAFDPHNSRMGLPADQVTLAERLQRAGYATGMVGKWHLGAAAPFHPLKRGFDFFYGFLGGGHDYFQVDTTVQLAENYKAALEDNSQPVGLTGYLTDVLTEQALRFIQQSEPGKPYFLCLAYNAPHGPLQAPEEIQERFKSIADPKRRTYAAMVSSLDEQIGRLVQEITQRGEREQTCIVFLSDNGGPENANASDNGPLRGQKGEVYEGGIHVPFVMHFPGTLPAGMVYEPPVISLDVTQTALELAGAELSDDLDGVNLVPFVRGETQGPPHTALFWRMAGDEQLAVRRGNDKLCVVAGTAQLFDLQHDLGETSNLASGKPQVVTELRDLYDSWNRTNQPAFFPAFREYHILLKEFHERLEIEARSADQRQP
jgi:arylsulfatase A-like enzyme